MLVDTFVAGYGVLVDARCDVPLQSAGASRERCLRRPNQSGCNRHDLLKTSSMIQVSFFGTQPLASLGLTSMGLEELRTMAGRGY